MNDNKTSGTSLNKYSSKYYTPSGIYPPQGPVLMLLFGGGTAVVLGFIYGYATNYNPFIYFNFIMSIIYATGVGMAVNYGAVSGKVRSPALSLLCGVIAGCFAIYVDWVVWTHVFLSRAGQDGIWLIDPKRLWLGIKILNENGVWSLGNSTPTGAFLYVVWAIEALVIIYFAATVSKKGASERAFCEECGIWTAPNINEHKVGPVDNRDQFVKDLEAGDLDILAKLGTPDASGYTEISMNMCPHCSKEGYLSAQSVDVTVAKGKTKEEKKSLISNVIIDPASIRDFITRTAEEPAPLEEEAGSS
jgi:hypothetical protein